MIEKYYVRSWMCDQNGIAFELMELDFQVNTEVRIIPAKKDQKGRIVRNAGEALDVIVEFTPEQIVALRKKYDVMVVERTHDDGQIINVLYLDTKLRRFSMR